MPPMAAGIPNPVPAVAATPAGLTHSSNVGICTPYLGASVPCGRKKKEAEAEPEADAYYAAYGAYPYAAGVGYAAYGAYPYAGVAATGLFYAAYGAYPYARVATTNAAVGHAVAYTPLGAVHSSHVGVCTNNLGAAPVTLQQRKISGNESEIKTISTSTSDTHVKIPFDQISVIGSFKVSNVVML